MNDNTDQKPTEEPEKQPETERPLSTTTENGSETVETPAQEPGDAVDRLLEKPPVFDGQKSHKKQIGIIVSLIILVVLAVYAGWWLGYRHTNAPAATSSLTTSPKSTTSSTASNVQGLQLDPNKNYGDKYSGGLLPVGDGKYTTSGPKVGYVYACTQYANNLATDNGGASVRGPWFSNNNTEYNINQKVHVGGSVSWNGSYTNTVGGATRTIVTNDLPLTDPTGIFPIRTSDQAYQYDRNPNTITGQSFTFALNASPTYGTTPNCIGGTVGVMTTGVEIFSAFDAGGRDAGAWEVQDGCQGHPQEQGVYHYHTLSSCIKDTSIHTVIGYALDGFPITGPTVGKNNILTTSDLDECHGLTSQINLDGKSVTMYHYVMTQDFPYSVSCYRSTAIQPPGLQTQQQAQQQGQIPNRR